MQIGCRKVNIVICFLSLCSLSSPLIAQQKEITITKDILSSAETILGITFTAAERDSMLDVLHEQLSSYKIIRNNHLENSIPPAFLFNPIPLGFKFAQRGQTLTFSDYSSASMPSRIEDLAFHSIGELAHLIKTRKVTSMQLTAMYLERLKKYGPVLHCVVTLTEERALLQAKKADEEIAQGKYRGMLHGIPFGIKDLFSTKTYKTTWGATPYKNQFIDEDATVVRKMESAGAVLCAKLSMGALARGDVWFGGKTRNPWDTSQGSSGSSAGVASSVSAGLLPFGIGTETNGSIISPATVCGVSGLRPTYGRVSRTGAMTLAWSADKIGPLCRNTEDLALVFSVIYGPDHLDQSVYDYPFTYQPTVSLKKLKMGYLKKDFDKQYAFHTNDSLALKILEQIGATLIPIELPHVSINELKIILSAESAAAFDELTRSDKDDLLEQQNKKARPNTFRAARFIPAVEYINANRMRYVLIQEMAKLMEQVDVYVSPSWGNDNLLLTNLSGHPSVVVPNGFAENKTPTSFTFVGQLFDEGTIIAVAKAYQDATDHHKKHPMFN